MRSIIAVLVIVSGASLWWLYWRSQQPQVLIDTKNFYDLSILDISWNKLPFSQFVNKKVLLVNIASHCGFTSQLSSLQNLYELYQDTLVIVWVPCNQFLNQTPENNSDMRSFCEKNYGVNFVLTDKVDVRWPNQHPIYQRLTRQSLNGVKNSIVKRNFQKYLIDEDGRLLDVFAPNVEPFDERVVKYLKNDTETV